MARVLLSGCLAALALAAPAGSAIGWAVDQEHGTRRIVAVERAGPGLLTSDSTRIAGLVTEDDLARGSVRAVAEDDPRGALDRLDDRIRANDRWRLPLELALAAVLSVLAFVRPVLAVRVVLVALAANLWLAPWLALLAALAAAVLPLAAASACVLAAYLLAMGLDAETVALSPLGPSQVNRFYGLSNLLATLLLVPALLGAARAGRAGVGIAALAVVTVAGNRFGADGGGLLVLLAGYAVLAARTRALPGRALAAALAAAAALALAVGSSHVTDALAGGPLELAGDLLDRVETSARRAVSSLGAAAVVAGGLAALGWVATRRPRTPVADALLAALAVSLLVNDTPTDVAGLGAVCVFCVRRLELVALEGNSA